MHALFPVKVKEQFELNITQETVNSNPNSPPTDNVSPGSPYSPCVQRQELLAIWRCFVYIVDEIIVATTSLGKDGKFQLFVCLCLR